MAQAIRGNAEAKTEKLSIVNSRVGQGKFRQSLLTMWDGKCCVSGLAIKDLLRASHIKPWSDVNNKERLDGYNGLLLGPQFELPFDQGFITFDDQGKLLVSSEMTTADVTKAGIRGGESIKGLTPSHFGYLEYHRKEVFHL
jgi:putative restriction endonuclease